LRSQAARTDDAHDLVGGDIGKVGSAAVLQSGAGIGMARELREGAGNTAHLIAQLEQALSVLLRRISRHQNDFLIEVTERVQVTIDMERCQAISVSRMDAMLRKWLAP
jgi:hypothetical protein